MMSTSNPLHVAQKRLRDLAVYKGYMGSMSLNHYMLTFNLTTRDGSCHVSTKIDWNIMEATEIAKGHINRAFDELEAKLDEFRS